MKEEIDNFKRDFENESDSYANKEYNGNRNTLRDRVLKKEREVEQLTLDLDKIRFSQKIVDS